MATNGLLIEFGITGGMNAESKAAMDKVIGMLGKLKSSASIEEFRFYPIVTGNRTQRAVMIMLEVSHQQLESLVVNRAYGELISTISDAGTNVTVNRAVTLERMLELSKQMM